MRPCEDGMEVKTGTPEVETRRATLGRTLEQRTTLYERPARV